MDNDPTLGIPLLGLLRASDQAPVKLNPDTWSNYTCIRRYGPVPATISRADLVAHARSTKWASVDPADVARLFVLTMAWGSGTTNGRGPRNTEKALAAGAATLDVLVQTRTLIAEGELAAAYQLHQCLPGVGPAFHTKWMWLMGTTATTNPRPLILDSLVWNALGSNGLGWNSLMAAGCSRNWGDRYVAYLRAAQVWAEGASTGVGGAGFTPEDVEYTLFERRRTRTT